MVEPDSLAEIITPEMINGAECEEIWYVAMNAYQELTGKELPTKEQSVDSAGPEGIRWKEEDLEQLFPKLCAKCY